MTTLEGGPADVKARISRNALVMRSIWFPSPRELRAWAASGVPAYVRFLPADGIEVGPRLASLWAACFCPVYRGRLVGVDGRTELRWAPAWPRPTIALLSLWAVFLAAWLAALALQLYEGTAHPGTVLFWNVLALATIAGPWLGDRYGRPALEEAARWVIRTASAAVEEEDW